MTTADSVMQAMPQPRKRKGATPSAAPRHFDRIDRISP